MSVSIFYFEDKKKSSNYNGYNYVNKYKLPSIFEASPVKISYKGKNITASEFGFGISSGIYTQHSELQNYLFKFISERLKNSCIQPVLFIYINNNNNNLNTEGYKMKNIAIRDIFDIFNQKIFEGLFLINE